MVNRFEDTGNFTNFETTKPRAKQEAMARDGATPRDNSNTSQKYVDPQIIYTSLENQTKILREAKEKAQQSSARRQRVPKTETKTMERVQTESTLRD